MDLVHLLQAVCDVLFAACLIAIGIGDRAASKHAEMMQQEIDDLKRREYFSGHGENLNGDTAGLRNS